MTWHTKANQRVLTNVIEDRLQRYLMARMVEAPGVVCHAVGGTDDHVHAAVSVPPTLLVSEWIGALKGASAYYINHEIANRRLLSWQRGYGVVSFGTRDLPWVVRYVLNQRAHHCAGRIVERLEWIDEDSQADWAEARRPRKGAEAPCCLVLVGRARR